MIIWLAKARQAGTPDKILGNWINDNADAKFEFFKSEETYQAKIMWIKDTYISGDKAKTDKNNPEPRLRNRPIIGLVIIKGLQFKNEQYVNGTIYSPEKGIYANCKLKLADENTLELTITKSIFTTVKKWKRL